MTKSLLHEQFVETMHGILAEYATEVRNADLKESTKTSYITHAVQFVRWAIEEDFIPGEGFNNGSNDIGEVKRLINRTDRIVCVDPVNHQRIKYISTSRRNKI